MDIEAKLTVSLKQLIETTCQRKRVIPLWLQGKTGHFGQQIQFSFLTQLKKYFVENNCYLQISNPMSYVFQLTNYEGYFNSRSYNIRINLSFSDVLMSNARTCIDSLLSFNGLEMFDILKVLEMFHQPSILKFLICFKERSLKLVINIFLEASKQYFCKL